jgi:hypothetical protein
MTYFLWVASLSFSSAMRSIVIATVALSGVANAEPADDGYCDYVQGAASAEASLLYAPEIFAEIGRIEQASSAVAAAQDVGTYRFIGGVRWRLSGLYEASATQGRADADCRRHKALEQIRGQTLYRALDAKAKIIDGALTEADKILAQVNADMEARRTTVPEATATRLRVEELRRTSAETHQALSVLPAPTASVGGLTAFQQADDDVESYEAKLRRAKAFDIEVRAGADPYLDATNSASPYFAVVQVGVNLGVLFQGGGNSRAAAGRRAYVRSGRDPLGTDATADRLRALLQAASKRAEETAALEADLERQIQALDRVGGDDSRRYRQTVWFDLIKTRAEHAYHEAYVAALKQVLGAP